MFSNQFLKNIIPYKLSSHKAWNIQESSTLKLDWNEATIPPSPKVISAIEKSLKSGRLNWYPNINNTQLLNSLAKYNCVSVDNVQYFASSDSLHEYVVRCFVSISDRILVVSPTYDNFRAVAESNGGQIQFYQTDNNFNLDLKQFSKDLKLIKPKLVYLVNPNNPTGKLNPINELRDLVSNHQNILFIIDEAYYEFASQTMAGFTMNFKNLIISRTFSKAFALASFRIGYMISHPENIGTINKIRNPKNISLFAQLAAIEALNDIEYTMKYVKEVTKSRTLFFAYLKELDFLTPISGSGNFIFLKFISSEVKAKFISHLETNHVFIRDYGHLENTNLFARITIGTIEQMEYVNSIIREFKYQ